MTFTVAREWDGNEANRQAANGRVRVSRGRWRWVLFVDGVADSDYDLRRDAPRGRPDARAGRTGGGPMSASNGLRLYTLLYRPPSFACLPKNASWTLVARPAAGFEKRTDLPVLPAFRFGVFYFDRPLTVEEVEAFELAEVAVEGDGLGRTFRLVQKGGR